MRKAVKFLMAMVVATCFFFAAGAVDAKEAEAHMTWKMKVNVVCFNKSPVYHASTFEKHTFTQKDETANTVYGTLRYQRAGLSPLVWHGKRIYKPYVISNTSKC